MPTPPPKASPSAPALSSAVPRRTSRPTTRSPASSAVSPTRFPSGAAASSSPSAPGPFRPSPQRPPGRFFPRRGCHKVLVLATTRPADVGVAASHWSLDDLAYHILKDAHFRDMRPQCRPAHPGRWRPEAAQEPLLVAQQRCRLRGQGAWTSAGCTWTPRALYRQGELVLCVDEKTGMQAAGTGAAEPAGEAGDAGGGETLSTSGMARTPPVLATLVVPTGQVIGSVTERTGGPAGFRAAHPRRRVGSSSRTSSGSTG